MKPIHVSIVGPSVADAGIKAFFRAEAEKLDHPIEFVQSENAVHVIRANDEPPLSHIDLRSDEPWKRERMHHGGAGRRKPSLLVGAMLGMIGMDIGSGSTLGSVCPPKRERTQEEVREIDAKRAAKEERRRKQREAAQAGQNRA